MSDTVNDAVFEPNDAALHDAQTLRQSLNLTLDEVSHLEQDRILVTAHYIDSKMVSVFDRVLCSEPGPFMNRH